MNSNLFLKLLLVSVLVFSSCQKEPKHDGYTIKGQIVGKDSGWVKLMKPMVFFTDTIKVLDSAEVINGKFEFKGKVDQVDFVQLNVSPRNDSYFFLENSDISIDINLSNEEKGNGFVPPVIKGSNTQDLYEFQRGQIDSIQNQRKYLPLQQMRTIVMEAKKSKDKALMEKVKAEMIALDPLGDKLQEELKNYKISFLKNHPGSPVTVYTMGMSFSEITMTREEMKSVYPLFVGDAKRANKFRFIQKTYDDYVDKFAVGATVEDFTLETVEGNNLTLSKVNADYILVDFWASWCVPCRASFPHLKEVYSKYKKDGFEIVGVATSDETDKWKKAIEKDGTPWKHVFDVMNENTREGWVAKAYGVPYLPTTFLLDSNRTIILRNPKKEELEEKLLELFGH